MDRRLSLGIDFGTNSVRVLLVDLNQGTEIASTAADYPSGEKGILLDRKNPHLARQYPGDYLVALPKAVKNCLQIASDMGYSPENIDGIGIDGTGSSPIPVDKTVAPLAFHETFRNNPNAQTWLWKDHTSAREAREISELASHMRPEYLAKCGGAYSSEWFFSKIFHCLKVDKDVFDAAYSWIELSDYIPAVLCGIRNIHQVKRNVCAAGHKAMYNQQWRGLPDEDFLGRLAPEMADLRMRLYSTAHTSDQTAGMLDGEWSD
ncbi:MAG: ribulokinase, partial [Calditrichaeota bacterium]